MAIAYLRYMFGTIACVLSIPAMLNLVIDPAGIYRPGRINPDSFAEALVKSKYGLFVPEDAFDERLVARALARHAGNIDCVVIGSSHAMQIGSARTPAALEPICQSVLNLAVNGAGIEDHITLAYLALQRATPSKLILGVDPWTMAFGKDQRWSSYKDEYVLARSNVLSGKAAFTPAAIDTTGMAKLANLINIDYTIRSIETAIREFRKGPPSIAAAHEFDIKVGGEHTVRLQDGSLVYSAKYIVDSSRASIPLGGVPYKTEGALNQPEAVDAYRALLLWIKSRGVEPIILMTPYHENVWKAPTSETAMALRATEPIVSELARTLGIRQVGSYEPRRFGCLAEEFYDFMHPSSNCLARLTSQSMPSNKTAK